MNRVWTVAKKEITGLNADKFTFFGLLFLGVGIGLWVKVQSDSTVFWLASLLGFFAAYTYTGRAFGSEKYSGTLETLLCSPLSLPDVWLGKLLGVVAPAYFISICTALAIVFSRSLDAFAISLPSPSVLVFLVLVLPMALGAFVGFFGSLQLFLDMKKNVLVTMVVMLALAYLISRYSLITDIGNFLNSLFLAACFIVSASVLAVTYEYTRRASLERAVTSI